MTDSRSPIGRFDPLKADDPSVGKPCVICKKPLCEGDVPSLISLAPADFIEAARAAVGEPYNAVAGIAHERCAWPSDLPRRKADLEAAADGWEIVEAHAYEQGWDDE